MAGATELRISVLTDPHLDWGIAVTVASVRALHHWLDSAARQRSMGIGRRGGILCATADMVIGECGGVAAGWASSGILWRWAGPAAVEARLAEVSARFSGFAPSTRRCCCCCGVSIIASDTVDLAFAADSRRAPSASRSRPAIRTRSHRSPTPPVALLADSPAAQHARDDLVHLQTVRVIAPGAVRLARERHREVDQHRDRWPDRPERVPGRSRRVFRKS